MIYSKQELSAEPKLERLLEEEVESHVQLIPVVESKHYGMNVVNIEDIISFTENSVLDFDEVLNEIVQSHQLDINNTIFSVRPSSVYLDEDIQYICSIIKENNLPLLLKNNDNSDEDLILNSICLECEQTESLDSFSLLEGELSKIGHDFGRTVVRGTARSMKKGLESGLAKSIDRNTFGRLLDSRDATTGKITKNGRITNLFGHGDNVLKDISGDVLDNLRKDASEQGVEAIKYKLRPMLDAVQKKLGFYKEKEREYMETHPQAPMRKRSLFGRILDKLRALRDKILAILRGRRQ